MKYLLDSHTLVWLIFKPDMVGDNTKLVLSEDSSVVYYSHASLWELELKYSKGRFLHATEEIILGSQKLGANELQITLDHIKASASNDIAHKDPFDMMLCAQAASDDMVLVTADQALLSAYPNTLDACA